MTNKLQIKIALAIDSDGNWGASGWGNLDSCAGDDAMAAALEALADDAGAEKRYWIELKLDVPKIKEAETIQRGFTILQAGKA